MVPLFQIKIVPIKEPKVVRTDPQQWMGEQRLPGRPPKGETLQMETGFRNRNHSKLTLDSRSLVKQPFFCNFL